MPLVTKSILSPGTYVTAQGPVTFTPDDIQRFHDTAKEMLADGIAPSVPMEHQPGAGPVSYQEKLAHSVAYNTGFVKDVEIRNGTLYGKLDINYLPGASDDEDIKRRLAKCVRFVSPELRPAWRAGTGKVYRNAITHVALTVLPVAHSQIPFGNDGFAMSLAMQQYAFDKPITMSLADLWYTDAALPDGISFDDWPVPVDMAAAHSPPGGVTIKVGMPGAERAIYYPGGRFIPSYEVSQADPATRAKLEASTQRVRDKLASQVPQPVAHENLQQLLSPHTSRVLSPRHELNARHSYRRINAFYGPELAHNRLHQMVHRDLASYEQAKKAGNKEQQELMSLRLRGLSHMLDWHKESQAVLAADKAGTLLQRNAEIANRGGKEIKKQRGIQENWTLPGVEMNWNRPGVEDVTGKTGASPSKVAQLEQLPSGKPEAQAKPAAPPPLEHTPAPTIRPSGQPEQVGKGAAEIKGGSSGQLKIPPLESISNPIEAAPEAQPKPAAQPSLPVGQPKYDAGAQWRPVEAQAAKPSEAPKPAKEPEMPPGFAGVWNKPIKPAPQEKEPEKPAVPPKKRGRPSKADIAARAKEIESNNVSGKVMTQAEATQQAKSELAGPKTTPDDPRLVQIKTRPTEPVKPAEPKVVPEKAAEYLNKLKASDDPLERAFVREIEEGSTPSDAIHRLTKASDDVKESPLWKHHAALKKAFGGFKVMNAHYKPDAVKKLEEDEQRNKEIDNTVMQEALKPDFDVDKFAKKAEKELKWSNARAKIKSAINRLEEAGKITYSGDTKRYHNPAELKNPPSEKYADPEGELVRQAMTKRLTSGGKLNPAAIQMRKRMAGKVASQYAEENKSYGGAERRSGPQGEDDVEIAGKEDSSGLTAQAWLDRDDIGAIEAISKAGQKNSGHLLDKFYLRKVIEKANKSGKAWNNKSADPVDPKIQEELARVMGKKYGRAGLRASKRNLASEAKRERLLKELVKDGAVVVDQEGNYAAVKDWEPKELAQKKRGRPKKAVAMSFGWLGRISEDGASSENSEIFSDFASVAETNGPIALSREESDMPDDVDFEETDEKEKPDHEEPDGDEPNGGDEVDHEPAPESGMNAMLKEATAEAAELGIMVPDDAANPKEWVEHFITAVKTHKSTKNLAGSEASKPEGEETPAEKPQAQEEPPAVSMSTQAVQPKVDPVIEARMKILEDGYADERFRSMSLVIDDMVSKGRIAPAKGTEWKNELGTKKLSLLPGKDDTKVYSILAQMELAKEVPEGTFWTAEEKIARLSATASQPARPGEASWERNDGEDRGLSGDEVTKVLAEQFGEKPARK